MIGVSVLCYVNKFRLFCLYVLLGCCINCGQDNVELPWLIIFTNWISFIPLNMTT